MDTDERSKALADEIQALAGHSTADLIGIAPGDAFTEEELGELGASFGPVRSVVVLAQRIVDPVQEVRFFAGESYTDSQVAVSLADASLLHTCWQVAQMIERAGHAAAIPRNQRYGGERRPTHRISFKKAGARAGIGVHGRSQLLIHPEWGPWMWLRAVVTDAALPTGKPIAFSPCEGCERCVAACPAGALIMDPPHIDRERCSPGGGRHNSTAVRLSPHGQINCDECMRACPVGTAPPRLGEWLGRENGGVLRPPTADSG